MKQQLPKALSASGRSEAFEAFKNGSDEAREKLIPAQSSPGGAYRQKYYAGATAEQEDLISIGTIGLIKAVNSFDNEKGARFATSLLVVLKMLYYRSGTIGD